MEALDLTNKIVIVTGASRGIGHAIALSLAQRGANLVIAARSKEDLDSTAAEIQANGGIARPFVFDLADIGSIRSLFSFTIKEFSKLDIMVNNAGVGLYGKFQDFSTDDLQTLIDTNIRGTYICCQEALRTMIPHQSGYIINISSVVGFKGYPNQSAYTASKHAVVGMTKSLAVEAQEHGIRASVIHPGGVATDLVLDARPDLDPSVLMQPEDIAQAVLYLLSLSERCAVDEIYIRRRKSKPF